MNPFKAKDLLPDILEGLPLELAEDLTEFYWNYVRSCLTTLPHYHVRVPDLGTFNIKGDKVLKEEIDKLNKGLEGFRRNPPTTTKKYAMHMEGEKKYNALHNLLDNYNHEKQAKKEKRALRKQIRDAKNNLATSQGNPGGAD